ncbi:hypothetical protein [Myxosarcina sp. GI1(2024)]
MVKTKQQQQLDLADRIEKVQALIDEISQEIETIKANAAVAAEACGIVRFRAKGKGGAYWYYKGDLCDQKGQFFSLQIYWESR